MSSSLWGYICTFLLNFADFLCFQIFPLDSWMSLVPDLISYSQASCWWLWCLCGLFTPWLFGYCHSHAILPTASPSFYENLQMSHCLPSTTSVFLPISFDWNSNGLVSLLSQFSSSLIFNLVFSLPHTSLLHLLPDLTSKLYIYLPTIFLSYLLIQFQSWIKLSVFRVII